MVFERFWELVAQILGDFERKKTLGRGLVRCRILRGRLVVLRHVSQGRGEIFFGRGRGGTRLILGGKQFWTHGLWGGFSGRAAAW